MKRLKVLTTPRVKTMLNSRVRHFRMKVPDTFYSEKNMAVLMESVRELDEGRGQEHELLDDA
ncbi:MAG: hypothetical protein IJ697_07365 [Synergistaceae bacterium]|nr:hypothetical protein [Synergistaceae bacterium]